MGGANGRGYKQEVSKIIGRRSQRAGYGQEVIISGCGAGRGLKSGVVSVAHVVNMASRVAVKDLEKGLNFDCSTSEDFSRCISQAKSCLEEVEGSQKMLLHAQLCRTLVSSCNEWIAYHDEHTNILMAMGPVKGLEIINSNISKAR